MLRSFYLAGLFGSILLMVWLAGFVMFMLLIFSMGSPAPGIRADAAIILTGGGKRIDAGLELLAEKRVDQVFVSGVHQAVRLEELLLLSPYHEKQDFPKDKITLGRKATDTIENASEAIGWIRDQNIKSAVLVTASYHMPRALYEFHLRDLDIEVTPYSVTPEGFTPLKGRFWVLGMTEYNKLIVRWLRSQIKLPSDRSTTR